MFKLHEHHPLPQSSRASSETTVANISPFGLSLTLFTANSGLWWFLFVHFIDVVYTCTPSYLGPFTYVADLPSRRGLRCSCSDCLVQPPVHRSTVGSRAFSVAGPYVWNCLPLEVTSAPSLAGDLPHSTPDVSVYILTFGWSNILSRVDPSVF